MNIGDVYYTFRGDGARLQADAKKEGAKAGDAGSKSFAGKFKSGVKGVFSSAGGAGLLVGAGAAAFGVVTSAVSAFVGALGDAQAAYREDQASQAQLRASLEANSEAYTGNASAIESVIEQRMALGFADDEQRESLASLVSITKDHTKALDLQRVAMDLARLRNIDLRTASDILGKVYGGNIGILSRYGIQLKKGATSTEALAEIQRRAAGQAEAFAETSEGKLLSSQVKAGEAMERLGKVMDRLTQQVLPPLVDGLTLVVDTLEALGVGAEVSMSDVVRAAENGSQAAEGRLRAMAADMGISVEQLKAKIRAEARQITADLRDTEGGFDDLGDASEDAADIVKVSARDMRDASRKLRDAWLSDIKSIIADYYDPIEDRAELAALKVEETELRKAIASGEATQDQIDDLVSLERRQDELLASLAARGETTIEEIDTAIQEWIDKSNTATGQAKEDAAAMVREYVRVKLAILDIGKALKIVGDKGFGGKGGGLPGSGRASGGPVAANTPYWVGERGPEIMVPSTAGTVIPSHEAVAIAASAPTPVAGSTYHVNLLDKMEVASPRDIVNAMRMLGDRGHLGGR